MAHPRLDTALTSVLANYFFRKQLPLNEDTEDFIKVGPPSSKRKNAQIAGCGSRNRLSHRYTALYSSYLAFARSSRHFSHFPTLCCIIILYSKGFLSQKSLSISKMERLFFFLLFTRQMLRKTPNWTLPEPLLPPLPGQKIPATEPKKHLQSGLHSHEPC